ncbi:MAG: hypothetical protein AABM43_12905 [Actinomycetota bacterium]
MYEYGAVFTLVGPDGTTVIFNDGLSGLWLEEVTGFDSPNIRMNIEELPETDGAIAGDAWMGQRPVTLKGKIAGLSPTDRNAVLVSLQRALRALRSDLTLMSQPSGLPAMQVTARLDNFRYSGLFAKDFLISVVCPDPGIYSQTVNTAAATQAGTPATPGAEFPLAFPINFGGGGGAYAVLVSVTNGGNFTAPAVFRVFGPIKNPQLTNADTGESLYVDSIELASGEWLDIDMGARTAVKSDGTSWYANVRFPASTWWLLPPGSTTVQLWGSGTTVETELGVYWRDTWC